MTRCRGRAAVPACTVATLVLAACSGGGFAPSSGAGAGIALTGGGARSARLSIVIPPARAASAAGRRVPDYISPATQSLAIVALYGSATPGPATVVDVSNGSSACTTAADGTRSCTATVAVLPGATQFDVGGFAGTTGSGALLEHARAALPDVTDSVIDIDVVLNGDIAALTLTLAGGEFVLGTPGTRTLEIVATDAAGYAIGGSTAYDVPVTLTPSDSAITIQPPSITTAGTTAVLYYNGDPNAATAITASVAGVSAATQAIRAVGAGAATPVPVPSIAPSPGATAVVTVH